MPNRTDSSAARLANATLIAVAAALVAVLFSVTARADRLHMSDGNVVEVDEAWEDAQGVWYRRGGLTQLVARARVRKIERAAAAAASSVEPRTPPKTEEAKTAVEPGPVLIYFVGGGRVEVEEVAEADGGLWFRRGNLSAFVERARVERVERGQVAAGGLAAAAVSRGWTTGRANLDALIRENGARHGVDPYLIFLVMEHESRFRAGAVSRAGARGLMQLMPATARRFGVRKIHDPAQNISAGTRYLKELLGMFGGRVDLALAGYNAGEGAVVRYGQRVPPYAETKSYVRRIGARYGSGTVRETQ